METFISSIDNALASIIRIPNLQKTHNKALRFAARVVQKRAKTLVPKQTGALHQSIRVFFRKSDNEKFFIVRAGGYVKNASVVKRFEKQARKERRTRDVSLTKNKKGQDVRRVFVWWAAANNSKTQFMQRAHRENSQEVIAAFAKTWNAASKQTPQIKEKKHPVQLSFNF